ncbi:hypothetical protein BDW66DRAFT_132110 [Aspergillus desertorum]
MMSKELLEPHPPRSPLLFPNVITVGISSYPPLQKPRRNVQRTPREGPVLPPDTISDPSLHCDADSRSDRGAVKHGSDLGRS